MKQNRKLTLIFFAIGCIFLTIAFIIKIEDNLPGILLLYLGMISLILAFVHRWRQTKKFKTLMIASIIGFPIFVVLHNLLEGLSKMWTEIVFLPSFLGFLSGLAFLLAVIICPLGLVIGLIGTVIIKPK